MTMLSLNLMVSAGLVFMAHILRREGGGNLWPGLMCTVGILYGVATVSGYV